MTAVLSPHVPRLLAAHAWQGQTNDCGPYATAILLRGLRGLDVAGEALAQWLNRPRWIGPLPFIRRIPNWATFPWGVVDALQAYGVAARWTLARGESVLVRSLQQGAVPLPIFGQWRPLWAHIAILVGYDPQRGWGFVDSSHSRAEVVWYDAATFGRWWRAYLKLLVIAYP